MDAVKDGKSPAEELDPRASDHRAADILIDQLVKAGVEVVFGIPGGAIAPMHDALMDCDAIQVVTTRHESGAVFAAAGYARATGRLGVVVVTSGPGVLNCMTGIASAYCDNLPVVVLAGEVPTTVFGKGALQEGSSSYLNVVGMATNITKLALELQNASGAPAALQRAMTTAQSGKPGPVLVTLPLDITTATVRRPGISSGVSVQYDIDDGLLRKIARTLSDAKRPVILAGSGVRCGTAPEGLRELAERVQIPVMTSVKGKGVFPEDHPLSLGVFGYAANPSTVDYLQNQVDVVLAVGTSLGDEATSGWSKLLTPSKHFIQIDAEALHIGRNYPVSVGLVGSSDTVLAKLLEHVPPRPRPLRRYGVRRHTDPMEFANGPNDKITPQRALWELQRVMPGRTVYTCDIGDHMLFAAHYLRVIEPDGFIAMTGLASMGSAIGSAIGAQLANLERQVVAICGDGGFAMSLGEIATAARYEIPIIVAVLNDRRYGMVERGNLALYGRTPDYGSEPLDVRAAAESHGAKTFQVTRSAHLLALEGMLVGHEGPVVLDIRIDPDVHMPKHGRFEFLSEQIDEPGAAE